MEFQDPYAFFIYYRQVFEFYEDFRRDRSVRDLFHMDWDSGRDRATAQTLWKLDLAETLFHMDCDSGRDRATVLW